jgi:hypothetical protein
MRFCCGVLRNGFEERYLFFLVGVSRGGVVGVEKKKRRKKGER